MTEFSAFRGSVLGDIFDTIILNWFVRCRPRLLIVTDGSLGYQPSSGFGLSRFVQGISQATPAPLITLAHRGFHAANVSIYGTNYPVLPNFNFNTAATAVTIANYDQIWLFGFSSGALPAPEVKRIADFMNAGGGVFATGDHQTLGQAMGGQLPRIRHMRDWANVPMGLEGNPTARNRIDTIVNPGANINATYDFVDQSDDIPQRIYPNYDVTFNGFGAWTATLHPLLRMPGTPLNRVDNTGFTNDIDMMPDHAHESVCFEVSTAINPGLLNGNYIVANVGNFQEFPNAVAVGGGRIGSRIIAYAVSGGRSVNNGGWKPPVNPRMFGIISAFDGHAAVPYAPIVARPGRAVCDSTWHHYVNINLDGTGTAFTALGVGTGVNFLPSIHLQKIFRFHRNTVDWLQPLNRIWCWIWIHLIWLRFHPVLVEELVEVGEFKEPRQFEALGQEAVRVMDAAYGAGRTQDAFASALRMDPATSRLIENPEAAAAIGANEPGGSPFFAHLLGKSLAYVAQTVPADKPDQLERLIGGDRHERLEQDLAKIVSQAAAEALAAQIGRAEGRLGALAALRGRTVKSDKKD